MNTVLVLFGTKINPFGTNERQTKIEVFMLNINPYL